MKKFTLVSLVAAAAFATTAAFTANSVSADTTTTDGTISFTAQKGDDGKTDKDVTLDAAPTVDFGSQTIDTSAQTYTTKSISSPITVTNPGINAGWTTTVAATDFTDGSTVLKGATLKLVSTPATAKDTTNKSTAPSVQTVTVNNKAQTIMSAADGTQGVGTWNDTLNGSDDAQTATSLYVPAGNVSGSYKATLTWTLTNAPTGEDK